MTAFRKMWDEIAPIGRDPDSGGYLRYSWTAPELELRHWFARQAAERGMVLDTDGNGNLWATVLPPDLDGPGEVPAVVTGSHFDSVPHGGGYDGPLGIVAAFLAVDELLYGGRTPNRPISVVAFAEEEGARFGVPCLGSRLLTGSYDPARALALRDRDGTTLADAMERAGAHPALAGPDPARVARVGAFVELHIEQGRALVDLDAPVGVASAIWPHGRWRFDFTGEGNHAGTTRMADRHDPMLTYAFTVLAANQEARARGAHATMARVEVKPNATNAIPSRVRGWFDARAADAATLDGLVDAVYKKAAERAAGDGTAVSLAEESASPVVEFDPALAVRLNTLLGGVPVLPTGAGHDAGVLSAHVPTAMLFVRNPSGVSHSPAEQANDDDCAAGVAALAAVLEDLACR